MATFLVTGGCGFIGSHLIEALLEQGHHVRVLDDLSTGTVANLRSAADLLIGDVADPDLITRASRDIAGCFHLAAIASVPRCNADWAGSHRVNLDAQIRVLEAARRRRFPVVYASSAAVYGDNPSTPLIEDGATLPRSIYGADKLGCELHARAGAVVHGIGSIGLRFFNVYGPRQRPDNPYAGVISVFAERILQGQPVTVFGDGEQSRDFVFVRDVAQAMLAAMALLMGEEPRSRAAVLNVCRGEAISILRLAEALMDLVGRRVPLELRPPREGDIRHSLGDPAQAQEIIGFRATTSLEDGLSQTLPWIAGQL
jgi:UDP-glucose 4-epimerase